jgi:hypothetical protein
VVSESVQRCLIGTTIGRYRKSISDISTSREVEVEDPLNDGVHTIEYDFLFDPLRDIDWPLHSREIALSLRSDQIMTDLVILVSKYATALQKW